MWLWSKLSAKQWEDAWEERFHGNAGAVISEIKGGKTVRVEVYCEEKAEAEEIQEQFGGSVREIKNRDWVAAAARPAPPIVIRDRFVVTQEAGEKELAALATEHPDKELLSIPAEMAFGTGDHPTTATCLRLLVDAAGEQKGEWSFLDAGTGSGLLAIAAAKLGAKPVLAFDFDEKAVEVGARNLTRNKTEKVELFVADVFDWTHEGTFPVVAANLFATILVQVMDRLVAWVEPGGILILSGIMRTQWDEVQQVAEKNGLIQKEHRVVGKWVTARFVRGEK